MKVGKSFRGRFLETSGNVRVLPGDFVRLSEELQGGYGEFKERFKSTFMVFKRFERGFRAFALGMF